MKDTSKAALAAVLIITLLGALGYTVRCDKRLTSYTYAIPNGFHCH